MRDFGPRVMARRQYLFMTIRSIFKKYGFESLETPAMENLNTLMGKYGEEGDQLLFKVLNSGDFLKNADPNPSDSKKFSLQIAEKGLRYDLTVPFARYVVMNRHTLNLPFKRYQIQPVWRADRPQKGRYREFYQCDADVVGTNSLICEAEIILMLNEVFQKLNLPDYTIKINHRKILAGLAEMVGAGDKESAFLVGLDKLDKMGPEKVREELISKGFSPANLDKIFELIQQPDVDHLKALFIGHGSLNGQKGVEDLHTLWDILSHDQNGDHHVTLDLSLARGLSYYTGMIFEVKAGGVTIGSLCGGGRYDDLTQAFGATEPLSGVGISFGIDRIYDVLEELDLFPRDLEQSSQILICHFDEGTLKHGLSLLSRFRSLEIASEIFPDVSKLKKQLDYANKKNIPFILIIGSEEINSGIYTLKNMETGEQHKLTLEDILKKMK